MQLIKTILSFLFLLTLSSLSAQVSSAEGQPEMPRSIDVLYLKGGSIFRGVIQEYIHEEKVSIKTLQGSILGFKADDIKYIRQEIIDNEGQIISPSTKPEKAYKFREQGIYTFVAASLLSGISAWEGQEELITGTSLNAIIGYQFNRLLGAGIGTGVDYYYLFAGETVYPLFLELRGYLKKKYVSPFYSLASGYSFAFKNENRDVIAASGGFLFYPSMGFRFGASENANFTLDFGLKFQKAEYTRRRLWGQPTDSTTHNMSYRRFTIRVGMIF